MPSPIKSSGGGGKPSRSASAIVPQAARGYHILKIHSYSLTKNLPTGEGIKSRSFAVGGYLWCLRYYPNGSHSDAADYVSMYLGLAQSVA